MRGHGRDVSSLPPTNDAVQIRPLVQTRLPWPPISSDPPRVEAVDHGGPDDARTMRPVPWTVRRRSRSAHHGQITGARDEYRHHTVRRRVRYRGCTFRVDPVVFRVCIVLADRHPHIRRRVDGARRNGSRDRRNASAIVANVAAMRAAIALSDRTDTDSSAGDAPRTPDRTRRRHRRTPADRSGVDRGQRTGPHGSDHVAPAADRVAELMDDLIEFTGRDDVPPLVWLPSPMPGSRPSTLSRRGTAEPAAH